MLQAIWRGMRDAVATAVLADEPDDIRAGLPATPYEAHPRVLLRTLVNSGAYGLHHCLFISVTASSAASQVCIASHAEALKAASALILNAPASSLFVSVLGRRLMQLTFGISGSQRAAVLRSVERRLVAPSTRTWCWAASQRTTRSAATPPMPPHSLSPIPWTARQTEGTPVQAHISFGLLCDLPLQP